MPCPHLKIKITQRSKRQSAVAGAAYQSGDSLFSEYDQTGKATRKIRLTGTNSIMPRTGDTDGRSCRTAILKWLEARKEVLAEMEAAASSPSLIELLMKYTELRADERSDWSAYGQRQGKIKASIMKTITGIEEAISTIQQHQTVHDKYVKIGWKSKKEKFAQEHGTELAAYNKADRFLRKQGVDVTNRQRLNRLNAVIIRSDGNRKSNPFPSFFSFILTHERIFTMKTNNEFEHEIDQELLDAIEQWEDKEIPTEYFFSNPAPYAKVQPFIPSQAAMRERRALCRNLNALLRKSLQKIWRDMNDKYAEFWYNRVNQSCTDSCSI